MKPPTVIVVVAVAVHVAAAAVVSCGHGFVDEFDLSRRWLILQFQNSLVVTGGVPSHSYQKKREEILFPK